MKAILTLFFILISLSLPAQTRLTLSSESVKLLTKGSYLVEAPDSFVLIPVLTLRSKILKERSIAQNIYSQAVKKNANLRGIVDLYETYIATKDSLIFNARNELALCDSVRLVETTIYKESILTVREDLRQVRRDMLDVEYELKQVLEERSEDLKVFARQKRKNFIIGGSVGVGVGVILSCLFVFALK